MAVLSFDISSSGITAAVLSPSLEASAVSESRWRLEPNETGAATLPFDTIVSSFKEACAHLRSAEHIDAVSIACFMHNSVLLDDADAPLTPVFTWLDRRGEEGVELIRASIGPKFHDRTGCHYHPMFPVFKLAALRLAEPSLMTAIRRLVSVKTILIQKLTGVWVEDHGMASASGLYDIRSGDWDPVLLSIAGISSHALPPVTSRKEFVGKVTSEAASEFGIPAGAPVVTGSGDGFLATLGSDCVQPGRIAMSLGTSGSARETVPAPILDVAAGTFCYRADEGACLLGCASSNGGNVLDWGRSMFGDVGYSPGRKPPIFLPLLHGERSPDWNPRLTASWHGLTSLHSAQDMGQSVLEGVVFNLAHYVEILGRVSGEPAETIVLSGNGFLESAISRVLASIVDADVRMPLVPGMITLRGAAICAFEALGVAVPPLHTEFVPPADDPSLRQRFQEYKNLRGRA